VVLAAWAAIAVENARLYGDATAQRDALERANRGLQATTTIARAVGAETDLDVLLDLIVKRARALVDARTVVVWLQRRASGRGQRRGDTASRQRGAHPAHRERIGRSGPQRDRRTHR
jgi:GAF domain-containing protein